MAIVAVTGNPVVGQKYTFRVDGSGDHAGVDNSTYFYDKSDGLVYYKNSEGTVLSSYNLGATEVADDLATHEANVTDAHDIDNRIADFETSTELDSRDTANRDADNHTDGTTNKVFTATEQTKLTGIETGATANDTDANLKDRANHTGTQIASTISDFDSTVTSSTHAGRTDNPHSVTKTQVGLGSVVDADTTTTANISDSSNKRFVTDAEQIVIGNTSGTNTGDETTGSIQTKRPLKTVGGESLEGIGDVAVGASTLNDLTDVSITTPAVDEILRFNGAEWVNGQAVTVSGGSGIEFFSATPIISAVDSENDNQVGTLSKIPVITAEQTVAKQANSDTVILSSWIDAAINRTLIDAGTWSFDTYAAVNSTSGGRISTITKQVYKAQTEAGGVTVTITGSGTSRTATASGGTPFATSKIDSSATNTVASFLNTPKGLYQITARTSDTEVTISTPTGYVNESTVAFTSWKKLFGSTSSTITSTGTDYAQYPHTSTQGAFTVVATDALAMITFFTSNNTTTATTPYNGQARNQRMRSPFITAHNELAELNTGDYIHLTAAEYTALTTPFTKVSVSYTAFTAAATTESITGFTITAGYILRGVILKPTTQFAGTGWSAATLEIGLSGTPNKYLESQNLLAAVSDTVTHGGQIFVIENWGAGTTVEFKLTTVGGNVNAGTDGAFEVYYMIQKVKS
jgi:hypothetical protein